MAQRPRELPPSTSQFETVHVFTRQQFQEQGKLVDPLGSSCRYTSWSRHQHPQALTEYIAPLTGIWDSESYNVSMDDTDEDEEGSSQTVSSMSKCSSETQLAPPTGPALRRLALSGSFDLPPVPPQQGGTAVSSNLTAEDLQHERVWERKRVLWSRNGLRNTEGRSGVRVMGMEQRGAMTREPLSGSFLGSSCRHTTWSGQEGRQLHSEAYPSGRHHGLAGAREYEHGQATSLTAMPLSVDKDGLSDPFSWKELERSCRHLDEMSVKISQIDLSCMGASSDSPKMVMYNVQVEGSNVDLPATIARPNTQGSGRESVGTDRLVSLAPSQSSRLLFPSMGKMGRRTKSDSHVNVAVSSSAQPQRVASMVQMIRSRCGGLFQKAST